MAGIGRLWHPEVFQGRGKTRNYFEGWYYKLIDRDRSHVMALIPGIALGRAGEDPHAFIQFIDAVKGKVGYARFPFTEFVSEKQCFSVGIGENRFTRDHLKLDLRRDGLDIRGELHFFDILRFPGTLLSPGIMGPYTFVPFMECYHGIVNIRHRIEGTLVIGGEAVDLTGGEGYIEKDWGRSFPSSWVWL